MNSIIYGTVLAIVVFFLIQMVLPFPYGLVFGVGFAGLIIWYAKRHATVGKDSVLNYRRVDPINKKEKDQNHHYRGFDNHSWLVSTFRNPNGTSFVTSVSIWNYTILCCVDPDSCLFDKAYLDMDEEQLQIIGLCRLPTHNMST